jgi:hypothetical protein
LTLYSRACYKPQMPLTKSDATFTYHGKPILVLPDTSENVPASRTEKVRFATWRDAYFIPANVSVSRGIVRRVEAHEVPGKWRALLRGSKLDTRLMNFWIRSKAREAKVQAARIEAEKIHVTGTVMTDPVTGLPLEKKP